MLALAHLPVFGWAKPVPVDFRRLRNPRLGMMLVAAAGPLSNLLLAAAAAVGIGAIAGSLTGKLAEFGFASFCLDNLRNFLAVNLFLALFNLLPVPPFDGSHIVEGALPRRMAAAYAGMRRYALPIMLILLVIVPRIWPKLDVIDAWVGPPFEWLAGHYAALAEAVARMIGGG
jgi:Zn-dependent protease